MDINQALDELGARADLLNDGERRDLDEKGYVVLRDIIDPEWLARLRVRFEELCQEEGIHAGLEVHQEEGTRRLSDLPNKGEVFDRVYTHPRVLAAIYHVIGRDFKLSSLNARDALPGQGLQNLHADWGHDYDGRSHVCNSVWLLDDFSRENGCTRLVPGTHKGCNPGNAEIDQMATHPDEEYVMAPAGTVAVFNSQTWHGGTLNSSEDLPRRAMHCYFTAREHGQQLDQAAYIRLSTWKRISRGARYILDVDLE
jgi:ectoine hydroxylase-related dioxygenase (phytanoyl-CoA dioxygenase family)